MDPCCYCVGYSPPANRACTCACHKEGKGRCSVCGEPETGRLWLGVFEGQPVYELLCARHLERAGSSAD